MGSFLRAFTFGHVRQLDAVAARFLVVLAGLTRLLVAHTGPVDPGRGVRAARCRRHHRRGPRHAKQGAGFGYTRVRGLNALLATLTTNVSAPVVVAQRLRKGACNSSRGAKRLVGDAVKQARRLLGPQARVLVRMDSAFYGRGAVHAALAGGAAVSVTVRMNAQIRAAIAAIDPEAWTTIEYTDAVFDEASGRWVSRAEVAEIDFTAFAGQKKSERVPGRLVVRRIPDFNADKKAAAGQGTLFDVWRFHAFFTTADPAILDTIAADETHRAHAIIEQVHADLKSSALAHLPSGVFTANAAWLVLAVIAFNLTRAAASLTEPNLAKATTATIRRRLIAVPARVAIRPSGDPAPAPGVAVGDRLDGPVRPGQRPATSPRGLTTQQQPLRDPRTTVEHPGQQGPANHHVLNHLTRRKPRSDDRHQAIGGSGLSRRPRRSPRLSRRRPSRPRRSPAAKSTAKKSTAKSTAAKSTAKKSPAKSTAAKKSPAKSTAKKSTAKSTTAKKSRGQVHGREEVPGQVHGREEVPGQVDGREEVPGQVDGREEVPGQVHGREEVPAPRPSPRPRRSPRPSPRPRRTPPRNRLGVPEQVDGLTRWVSGRPGGAYGND